MVKDKEQRTYVLREDVVDWIDANYERMPSEKKSALVERAVMVYASKLNSGEWTDSKLQEKDDDGFRLLR